jgi:hypothetical protein
MILDPPSVTDEELEERALTCRIMCGTLGFDDHIQMGICMAIFKSGDSFTILELAQACTWNRNCSHIRDWLKEIGLDS